MGRFGSFRANQSQRVCLDEYAIRCFGNVSESSTLEFEFNNVPAAFGLDDVSVEAASEMPIFQSVALTGNTLSLTLSAFRLTFLINFSRRLT